MEIKISPREVPEPGEGRTDVLSVAPSVQRVAVEAASYTDAF